MFFHKLQHAAKPDAPDAVYARKLQEVIGGQYGEITVAMQYAFQAWNIHLPGKYRDLIFGIASEEFGHVEMLATMVSQLLADAPLGVVEGAVQNDPTVAAIVGGTDPQQAIVAGAGARPVDSNGNPWTGGYVTASGNLLADFTSNANAEMQGRLQVARLYHMTDDAGVRDLLSFLLARDTMHQNMWIAAARQLQEEGAEKLPVPGTFPLRNEDSESEYQYLNFSDGQEAGDGPWASGPSPDGHGEFSYVATPPEGVPMPAPTTPDSRYHGTTPLPSGAAKVAGAVKDALHRE